MSTSTANIDDQPDYHIDIAATKGHRLALSLDFLMLGLLAINLSWIIFDGLFSIQLAPDLLRYVVPNEWVDFYAASIHPNFLAIDLAFVSVFIAEFVFRWTVSIIRRDYRNWLAFPLIHWYDVLGCIPLPVFRWFRLLRFVAIVMRLHDMGVIDYRSWMVVRWVMSAYNVVVEEISDRVVVRVLDGVQDEIATIEGFEAKIVDRVIAPRQQALNDAVAQKLSHTLQTSYTEHQVVISEYVRDLVSKAVHENSEVKLIDKMPLMGGMVSGLLDHAVTDIVNRVIEGAIEGTSEPRFQELFADVTNTGMHALLSPNDDGTDNHIIADAVVDLLEVIKDEMKIQRWREG